MDEERNNPRPKWLRTALSIAVALLCMSLAIDVSTMAKLAPEWLNRVSLAFTSVALACLIYAAVMSRQRRM